MASERLNLYVPDTKIPIVQWAKQKYGSELSKITIEYYESLKEGAKTIDNSEISAHPSNEKAVMIFERIFSNDIEGEHHGEYGFRRIFDDQSQLRTAISGRFDVVFTKYGDVYLDVKDMFCETYPKLAEIMGYKAREKLTVKTTEQNTQTSQTTTNGATA